MFKPLCSTFLILMVFISSPSFADDHSADAPCPEFNNNQYMKWIDLDASCKTRKEFIADIEAEGLWTILDDGEGSWSVLLEKKDDPNETADVFFGAVSSAMAASIMTVSKTIDCVEALRGLENIGFPTFSDAFVSFGEQYNLYAPINIGTTGFLISGNAPPKTCNQIVYILAQHR